MTKKILALVLSVLMILSIVPVMSFAAGTPVTETVWWGYDEANTTLYIAASENAVKDYAQSGSFDGTEIADGGSDMPWYGFSYYITKAVVADDIAPASTAYWFAGFYNCEAFDIAKLNTVNVTSMHYMFSNCESAETIDVSGFKTPALTDMAGLFSGCKKLKSADISKFDTSKVTKASSVFYKCLGLTEYVFPALDLSKNETVSGMFENCENLEFVDISNLDTSNVSDFQYMFNYCHNLREIKGVEKLNTSKATNMGYMFNSCYALEAIDLSNFDISNVTYMTGMLEYCNSLTTIDLSSFDLENKDIIIFDVALGVNSRIQSIKTPVNYARNSYLYYQCKWVDEEGTSYDALPMGLDHSITIFRTDIPRTVSFDANGGSGEMGSITVEYDNGYNFVIPASKFTAPEGKEFKGWAERADGAIISADILKLTTDITLYAIWGDKVSEPEGCDVCPYCHRVHNGLCSDLFCIFYKLFYLIDMLIDSVIHR